MRFNTSVDLANDNVYNVYNVRGHNSVANFPKFELILTFMYVLVTCKNEEDSIKNEGVHKISPIISLWEFFDLVKGS